MDLKILEIRLQSNGKPLKAFVDIKLDEMVIRDFRIIKENGKRPWVASPQISWRDRDGAIKYKTVITLSDEVKGEIDRLALNAWHREMEKKDASQIK